MTLSTRQRHLQSAFGLAMMACGLGLGSAAIGSTQAATPRYCANFEFLNNTGQDVNGLHLRLKGIPNVSSTYIGPFNPFGAPDLTSGYDSAHDVYLLNFSNGTAPDGDTVLVGFCSNAPFVELDPSTAQPNFYWSLDGNQALPNPLFTGVWWEWSFPAHLRIHVLNGQPFLTLLTHLNLLDGGIALTLDDLNEDAMGSMPAVSSFLETPQTLAANSDTLFEIGFGTNNAPMLEWYHPYVLQAVLTDTDDLGNATRLYAQALAPFAALHLPIIAK